jgi:hypothetical protein
MNVQTISLAAHSIVISVDLSNSGDERDLLTQIVVIECGFSVKLT